MNVPTVLDICLSFMNVVNLKDYFFLSWENSKYYAVLCKQRGAVSNSLFKLVLIITQCFPHPKSDTDCFQLSAKWYSSVLPVSSFQRNCQPGGVDGNGHASVKSEGAHTNISLVSTRFQIAVNVASHLHKSERFSSSSTLAACLVCLNQIGEVP